MSKDLELLYDFYCLGKRILISTDWLLSHITHLLEALAKDSLHVPTRELETVHKSVSVLDQLVGLNPYRTITNLNCHPCELDEQTADAVSSLKDATRYVVVCLIEEDPSSTEFWEEAHREFTERRRKLDNELWRLAANPALEELIYVKSSITLTDRLAVASEPHSDLNRQKVGRTPVVDATSVSNLGTKVVRESKRNFVGELEELDGSAWVLTNELTMFIDDALTNDPCGYFGERWAECGSFDDPPPDDIEKRVEYLCRSTRQYNNLANAFHKWYRQIRNEPLEIAGVFADSAHSMLGLIASKLCNVIAAGSMGESHVDESSFYSIRTLVTGKYVKDNLAAVQKAIQINKWPTPGEFQKLQLLIRFESDQILALRAASSSKHLRSNPEPLGSQKPNWDNHDGKLYFLGKMVRHIKRKGTKGKPNNVVLVLDAFQELSWPKKIDDPLPGGADPERLNNTVKSLNDGISGIRFRADGSGGGIVWEMADTA